MEGPVCGSVHKGKGDHRLGGVPIPLELGEFKGEGASAALPIGDCGGDPLKKGGDCGRRMLCDANERHGGSTDIVVLLADSRGCCCPDSLRALAAGVSVEG